MPSARSGSSGTAPGSPGGKSAPDPPAIVHQHSSSSSASTVKTSSPLNPARTLSPSPHTTPTSKPAILAPSHSDPPSYDSTPKTRPRVSSTSSVPRGRGPSPLRDSAASNALQITRVASNPLPDSAPDAGGITSRGFSLSSFRSRSRSTSTSTSKPRDHSPEVLAVVGEDDLRASVMTPVHAWWHEKIHPTSRPWSEGPKRKKTVPPEQTENYLHTKERVVEATASVLGAAARITHEALFIGVDFLKFAPVPALEVAGTVLLNIWEAVEMIEMNRLACLRLTERCAETLISVREEIQLAGAAVAHELQEPISKLQDAFKEVHVFLQKQAHRPFLHRYLKRDEIQRSISHCDASLNDALDMFSIRVQIRTLKLVQANETRRQHETDRIFDSLGLKPLPSVDGGPPAPRTSTATITPSAGQDVDHLKDPREVQKLLQNYRREQNNRDRANDLADLRQLMRTALQTNNDAAMIEVLQIARDEMPEAIKTLQRALEREVERERYPTTSESSTSSSPEASPVYTARGRASRALSVTLATLPQQRASMEYSEMGTSSEMSNQPVLDTLDREFLETGIDALRRLSQGTDLAVPNWTITRYEVELDEKIGIGFFSDVYKGQWHDHIVAIKVLAETTPRKLFVHEIGIWKTLDHPNVLELLGASSATGDPPWFLVSPYYRNGNLVQYLKGLALDAPVDMLRMMHQISKGMSYLHGKSILHGDLKAANILVDDRLHCIISDFGQSEMKSEVFRLSRQPMPHGTLRWQSPELMRGAIDGLTPGVDVYAFGILCVEILSRGALPWPIADDDAVRRFVIEENKRPSLPLLPLVQGRLTDLIQSAWNRDPDLRPSFLKIERDLRTLRRQTGAPPDSPRPPSMVKRIEEEDWARSHHQSPDMRPIELPDTSHPHDDMLYGSSSSGATSYDTATSQVDERSSMIGQPPSRRSSVSTIRTAATTATTTETTSDSLHDSVVLHESMLESGYLSPIDPNSVASEFMNERRYRMLLQHEYHTTLTLPLWTPGQVRLGAVGYISKPEGSFVTLFNSTDRLAPDGSPVEFPSFSGYGRVVTNSMRLEKRNAAERGIDLIRGFLSSKRKLEDGSLAPAVSRTQSFQLRSGHKVAYMYAESTVYRYMEDLRIPKLWFEANIDGILAKYGRDHKLTRGDVFLVIGALEAQDYAMFVSHTHPDGQVNFDVFSGVRPGEPWGEFVPTTATGPSPFLSGPAYDGEGMGTMSWASKVSRSKGSLSTERWDSVLLARLRFKPDASEPTRL